MATPPNVTAIGTGDEYVRVRFRDPDKFDTIRTPDWAQRVAESVVAGSEVRTGRDSATADWFVQSVLIPKDRDEEAAMTQAKRIVEKIRD